MKVGSVLKIEIKKAMKSKGFFLSLLAGFVIAGLQTVWFYRNKYTVNNEQYRYIVDLNYMDSQYGSWFENRILEGWIGCEAFSAYNQMFFLLMPLLSSMPYGISLLNEWKSGYAGQMIARCGRKRYLSAKFIAVFISGGIAAALPLVLNLLATACYLPIAGVDPLALQSFIWNADMWGKLYYEYPILYALGYICIDFIYGGIFACMTLVCTKWLENRFGAVMFPLMINCACYYGIGSLFITLNKFNFSVFINPAQPAPLTNRFDCILIVTVVLTAALAGVYAFSNRKRDATG